MKPSDFWLSFLGQALLRGTVWLLLIALIGCLVRKASAARRALVYQMGFLGLILLPMLLLCLPPLPLMKAYVPSVTRAEGASPETGATSSLNRTRRPSVKSNRVSRPLPSDLRAAAPSNPPSIPAAGYTQGPREPAAAEDSAAIRSIVISEMRAPTFMWAKLKWLLFVVWAVGASYSVLSLAFSLFALRRLGANVAAAPPELLMDLRDNAGRLGLSRMVTLRIASLKSGLHAPVTWGLVRPVVMLPPAYPTATAQHCRVALLHELAHIKRGDWAWLLSAQVICALYWCVPFVWIALRGLRRETELACDDCVLTNGVSAPEYATQILEVARLMKTRNALPGSALTMARPPLAESRIRAILDPRRSRQPVSSVTLALAVLLPLVGVPIFSLRAVGASTVREQYRLSSLQPEMPESAPPASPALTPDLPAGQALSTLPQNWGQRGDLPYKWRPGGDPVQSRALGAVSHSNIGDFSPHHVVALSPPQDRLPADASTGEPIVEKLANSGGVFRTEAARATSARTVRIRDPQSAVGSDGHDEGTRSISWGPAADGLQAGLRLVKSRAAFTPGEIIWQEAYLRNRSKEEVVVTASGGYEEQGAPTITDASSARVKVLRYFGMGAMFTVSTHVRPGEIAIVGRFAVAFDTPGKGSDEPHEVAAGLSSSAEGTALALEGPGSYVLRQEIAPFSVNDKARRRLMTGPIALQIAGEPVPILRVDRNHILDLSNAPIAWGKAKFGLQVGLIALGMKSNYYIGERVRVAVVVRNVADKTISFWHETSFAFLEPPVLMEAGGTKRLVKLVAEAEWKTLHEIQMTGVTFDMTFAPSADGPSRLRRSDIEPGQSVIGYYLTAFVPPSKWPDGRATPGRYRVIQPVRLGLGDGEQLDTPLETGALDLEIRDPDAPGPPRR